MEDLSEKEQIDKIREWWSDYGSYVIGGIVIGAAILYGWNYYQSSEQNAALEASALYSALTDDVVEERLEAVELTASELFTDYADTPYASQAGLALARLYMDQNRDQDAADTLRDLIASNAADAFKSIARLRLAKVLLYQEQPEAVFELLEGRQEPAFEARYAEALGDAYAMLDRHADAREAYQRALSEPAQAATVDRTFVQLKLLDLPVAAAGSDGEAAEQPADNQSGTDGQSG